MMHRTYSELISISSFKERFLYLKLNGVVGKETFGFQRWLNQVLYHSGDWLSFRDDIIIRDAGCDLSMPGFDIYGSIIVHHINPISYEDVVNRNKCVFDPENVVCTKLSTHNAIHYGDEKILSLNIPIQRSTNDTCPWKK